MHYGTRVIIIIIRRRIYVQRGLQLQDYWPWCTAVVVNKVIIFLDKIHLLPTDGLPSQSAKSIYYVPAIIHQNLLTCFSGKKQWRFQRGIIFTKTYDDVSSNTKGMICKTQRNSFTIRTNASRSHKKYIHRKSDFIKYFYSVINQWYDFQLSLFTRLGQ